MLNHFSILAERYRVAAVHIRSFGILRIPHLRSFLPECDHVKLSWKVNRDKFDAVVGWGHKATAARARAHAKRKSLPYLALEDGFIRSVALGVNGSPPLSVVVDDVGIYYDATSPSRLEQLIEVGGHDSPELLDRARKAINWIVRERLSKYNHAPCLEGPLPGKSRQKILVVDQSFGDCSITYGLAGADTFIQMLSAALDENPEADIIIKTHPDVLAGKKHGYLTQIENLPTRVHLLTEEVNPLSLIEKVDRVYTVTSQLGFEALMLGKPVDCFGVPFYSGWGLTRDRQTIDRRTRSCSLEEVFAAAYILYPRYLNPYTNKMGTLENVLDYLTLQVKHLGVLSGQSLLCVGFRWWKYPYIRKMLKAPGNRVLFANRLKPLLKPDKVVVWGDGSHLPLMQEVVNRKIPILRMEDGFVRSVGLGSNLVRPHSLILDSSGIYFDPTHSSDLENILRETVFTEVHRRRAIFLRQKIVINRISKYNIGNDESFLTKKKACQTVILVPGQVEDDASIRLGCVDLRTNIDLLREVRNQNPDAYIIYKPHPDVLVGNRTGHVTEKNALQFCDQILTDLSMPACLDVAEEVHTLTSLAGFEALLRDKRVVCYGIPFYAGWGLTRDRHSVQRRGRQLSIDELVAGVLILYPSYFDWESGDVLPVEVALDRLRQETLSRSDSRYLKSGYFRNLIRKISGFLVSLRTRPK